MWRVIPILLCLAAMIIYDARANPPPGTRVLLALAGLFLALAGVASLIVVR